MPGRNDTCKACFGARYVIEQTQSRQRKLDLIGTIEEKCRRYAQFPEGGTARPDLGPELRYFPVVNLLVVYRPTDRRRYRDHLRCTRPSGRANDRRANLRPRSGDVLLTRGP